MAGMDRQLASKVALITGAGRGIGRATAELFARQGAKVVLCARTRHEIDDTAARIVEAGGEATAYVADIGVPVQASGLPAAAVARYGRLDILINNAGILGARVPLVDYPLDVWTEVLRINLSGTFVVSQAAAKLMERQRAGCILTLSSSVGRAGRGRWGAYAVTKFGVEGLSQVMADELRSAGVVVLTLNPGGTRTRMRKEAYPDEDPARVRDPHEAAEALLYLAVHATTDLSGMALNLSDIARSIGALGADSLTKQRDE
jgi:NAD(P)-dependent dehydrogenase (short-subunit alcohol dehydrogenase family)